MGGKQKLTTTMLGSQGISIPPQRGQAVVGQTINACSWKMAKTGEEGAWM